MTQQVADHKQKTIDYYDQNAAGYAAYVDDFYSTEQISAFLGYLPQGAKVLDVGCGSGRDVFIMSKSGVAAVGLDLSKGMIDYAKSKYPQLQFLHGDMLQTGFPDQTFDGVWAHASLLHLESEAEVEHALSEFNRIMKPEGMLHVLVKLQKDADKVKIFTDGIGTGARLYRFYTKDELAAHLQKFGFELVIMDTYEENERNPKGRHDVTWLHCLARKVR